MKSTGIVRKIDDTGRLIIPKELREQMGINCKEAMEIFVDEDKIVIQKYKSMKACSVTGEVSEKNRVLLDGKLVLSKEGERQLLEQLSK